MKTEIRYMRAQTLFREAVDVLCIQPGGIRERLSGVDWEIISLRTEEMPTEQRTNEAFEQLQSDIKSLQPKGDEGYLAATIQRAQFTKLQRISANILEIHRLLEGACRSCEKNPEI